MKSDVTGSTPLFRALLASDLQALMAEHRAFVAGLAAEHGGRIVRFAGDGYWLEFPSVTAAARSAVAMQETLRLDQANKGADRLSMRLVIGVGDVALQGEDLIGDVLAVISRIEAITPPDEIYLTSTARMISTAAEIQTALVGSFTLKGLGDAIEIWRMEQRHRTRITKDACIRLADLRHFTKLAQTLAVDDVERLLNVFDMLVRQVTAEAGGAVRFGADDSYCVTFPDAAQMIGAADRLRSAWSEATSGARFGTGILIILHRGDMNAFRCFLYGKGLVDVSRALRDVTAMLDKWRRWRLYHEQGARRTRRDGVAVAAAALRLRVAGARARLADDLPTSERVTRARALIALWFEG